MPTTKHSGRIMRRHMVTGLSKRLEVGNSYQKDTKDTKTLDRRACASSGRQLRNIVTPWQARVTRHRLNVRRQPDKGALMSVGLALRMAWSARLFHGAF